MKRRKAHFYIAIASLLALSCSSDDTGYIDSDYPSAEPRLFAESIIREKFPYIQCMDVSSDKKEYYFQLSNANWSFDKILCLKLEEDGSYSIDTVVDSKNNNEFKRCGEPCISKDGKELFFSNLRDIWKLNRENGKWSKPVKLDTPVNTDWKEGHPSISSNGTLYFHSLENDPLDNCIFYSRLEAGSYKKRTRIAILSEEGDAGDPGIAPDESFIVFASSRKSGYGKTDLYISFKRNDSWSTPQNLGPEINTSDWELGPKISPDGKYLFYYQRDTWKNAEYSNIYWVSIEKIKEKLSIAGKTSTFS